MLSRSRPLVPAAPVALGSLGLACALAGCTTTDEPAVRTPEEPDVPVARAPFGDVVVQFKETLDQQYVYVEHVGPLTDLRPGVQRLLEALDERGVEPAGPLFVQYVDDPRGDPTKSGRVQVGVPVDEPVSGDEVLRYATAGPRTVVYSRVEGPFGSGRAAYRALDEHLRQWGWVQHGPIREIYAPAGAPGTFAIEVQIPWTPGQ